MKQLNTSYNVLIKTNELLTKKIENNYDINWSDDFENFCKIENFIFDDVLLFMGCPLWDSDDLKHILLDGNHGIILQSKNKYEIKNALT